MADLIKKFNDFENKKQKKFNKNGTYEPLSNDIITVNNIVVKSEDDENYIEVKEPVNILQITGMITDPDEIKKIDEAFTLDTSVVIKDIKRGDILYLTALLEKTTTTSRNPQNWGVVKVRVVDYYWGLNKLNQLRK
jgi:hypothetical protein